MCSCYDPGRRLPERETQMTTNRARRYKIAGSGMYDPFVPHQGEAEGSPSSERRYVIGRSGTHDPAPLFRLPKSASAKQPPLGSDSQRENGRRKSPKSSLFGFPVNKKYGGEEKKKVRIENIRGGKGRLDICIHGCSIGFVFVVSSCLVPEQ